MSSQAARISPLAGARMPTLRLVLAAVAVLAIAATALVALVRTAGDGSTASSASRRHTSVSGSATPTGGAGSTAPSAVAQVSSARAATLAWALANLPSTVPIVAPDVLGEQLRTNGFTAVTMLRAATGAVTKRSWVLTEAGQPTSPRLLASAPVVAVFGPPDHRVVVRYAMPGWTPAAVRSMVGQDRASRVQAGLALAQNPGVHGTGAIRAQLRSGSLDYRAATFLALLSNETSVTVTALHPIPAERNAGSAARSLTITVGDAAQLTTALAALPNAYRPARVGAAHSSATLTWPIAADPVQPVQ